MVFRPYDEPIEMVTARIPRRLKQRVYEHALTTEQTVTDIIIDALNKAMEGTQTDTDSVFK